MLLVCFRINSLSIVSFVIIFSNCEGCLFTLLIASFVAHTHFIRSSVYMSIPTLQFITNVENVFCSEVFVFFNGWYSTFTI